MLLLAHRGYSAQYPENTLKAFQEAIKIGFDGIETDVHKTKDGKLVLCHDEKIDRTSNGKGYIKDMTYQELCQYNFCYKFKNQNEKIPLLKELLEMCQDTRMMINIEVKTDKIQYDHIEQDIYEIVKSMGMLKQVIFSSFHLESLLTLRQIDSTLYLGYLFEDHYEKNKALCLKHHFHAHPDEVFLNADEIQDYLDQGLDINTWTVKNRFRYEYFKEQGIHAVIANKMFKSVVIL